MGWLQQLGDRLATDRRMRRRGEQDAPTDTAHGTRGTGGVVHEDTMDQNSSTGTTPNDTYVGRAGSDETGDVGLSGAEARGGGQIEGRTGAARDE